MNKEREESIRRNVSEEAEWVRLAIDTWKETKIMEIIVMESGSTEAQIAEAKRKTRKAIKSIQTLLCHF